MALTIITEGGNNDSKFPCSASPKQLRVIACGGRPPYTWSTTKGTITPNGASGQTATLAAAANPGFAFPGDAYQSVAIKVGIGTATANCPALCSCSPPADPVCVANPDCKDIEGGNTKFSCNDIVTSTGDTACGGSPLTGFGSRTYVDAPNTHCINGGCGALIAISTDTASRLGTNPFEGTISDIRTGAMIAAGCNPCPAAMLNTVITVTDSLGTSVSRTLTGIK